MEEEPVELVDRAARRHGARSRSRSCARTTAEGDAAAGATRRANVDGEWVETRRAPARRALGRGSSCEGPAIVEFAEATCLVRPGWAGAVDDVGTLVLERP